MFVDPNHSRLLYLAIGIVWKALTRDSVLPLFGTSLSLSRQSPIYLTRRFGKNSWHMNLHRRSFSVGTETYSLGELTSEDRHEIVSILSNQDVNKNLISPPFPFTL